MRILVSACLLGVKCRYNGVEKANEAVVRLAEKHTLVPFCPEIYGGLSTPRAPAEIKDGRVMTEDERDVTLEYRKGAEEALRVARILGCECALLQDRSPSCGIGVIHNGMFDGGLIPGDGVTAALLRDAGMMLIPASEADKL